MFQTFTGKLLLWCRRAFLLLYLAENTHRGSFTVWLTSCFTCLDSAAMLMLNKNRFTCLVVSNQEVNRTVILPL